VQFSSNQNVVEMFNFCCNYKVLILNIRHAFLSFLSESVQQRKFIIKCLQSLNYFETAKPIGRVAQIFLTLEAICWTSSVKWLLRHSVLTNYNGGTLFYINMWLYNWGITFGFPVGARNFCCLPSIFTGFGAHLATCLRVEEAHSIRIKRPGHEADLSPPSSVDVNNERRYNFIPLRLHVVQRECCTKACFK